MKHLLTKQHLPQESAALTLSTGSNSQETFISNVDSAIELHSRDPALIHNHKSTLFACASVYSLAVMSFMRFSDIRLCRALLHEECVLGPLKNGQTAHDYLVKLVNVWLLSKYCQKHTRFTYKTQLVMSKIKVNSWENQMRAGLKGIPGY